MKKRAFAVFALVLFIACGSHKPAPPRPDFGILPEISDFLDTHKEFGNVVGIEDLPDWAKGKRQKVKFDGSIKSLLFYVKDEKVVTVYEDSTDRKIVWGKTES